MGLTAIVTNAGRAALVNAANTGTRAVTIAQVGLSGTALAPEAGATVLPGQFKTIATLSGDVVADDTIHLIVRDESADVFTVRSLALYLADGTLFALYGQADVLLEKSAQALMLLAIDIRFEDVDASAITFGDTNFLNPPATTERQGVVELATVAEAQAGIDALRALTPQAARSAILGWLLAQDGAGSGLDADLLDGQQGSWYTNIAARLGYVPWGPTNDGAGSGLDADLLDGLDSSYFVNIPARLGYAPVNKAGDTFTGLVSIQGVGLAAGIRCYNTVANRDYRVIQKDDGSLQITDETDGVVRFAITSSGTIYHGTSDLMWHAGNDGAGSGLDADLLDGRQASDFALLSGALSGQRERCCRKRRLDHLLAAQQPGLGQRGRQHLVGKRQRERHHRHLHTIVSRSRRQEHDCPGHDPAGQPHGGSAPERGLYPGPGRPTDFYGSGMFLNGNPLWRSDNDGAGSGLDADLLDGQQGSWYADIIGRLGYAPVQQGTGIGQRSNAIKMGWNGSKLQLTVDTYDQGNIVTEPNLANASMNVNAAYVQRNNNHLWGPDNDGSGSGLDADLLDGFQADAFARITAQSIGSTGYLVLSNGLKIVYGTVQLTQDAYSYATFPIAFESAPAVVFPTIDTVNNSSDQNTLLTARTMNGFTVFQAADISNVSLPYIAIGR
jgi:hypothetical protein